MRVQSFFEVHLEYPEVDLKSCEVPHLAVSLLGRTLLGSRDASGWGEETGWHHCLLTIIPAIDLLDV